MTPDRTDANPDENADHGVLDESGNLDTASITILGGHIAQVNVDLPVAGDDDLDDDVIEDELPIDDPDRPLLETLGERRSDDGDRQIDRVHHVELLPTGDVILEPHDDSDDAASTDGDESHDVQDAELVDDGHGAEIPYAQIPDADHVEHAHDVDPHTDHTDHTESSGADDAEPRDAVHADADDAERADAGDEHEPDAREHRESSEHGSDTQDIPEGSGASATTAASHEPGPRDGGHDTEDGSDAGAATLDHAGARDDVLDADLHGADLLDADLHDAEIVDEVELFEADAADPDDLFGTSVTDAPSPQSSHDPGDAVQPAADAPEVRDAAASGAALTHAPWIPAVDRSRADENENDAVSAPAVETDEPASESATAPEEDDVASEKHTPDTETTVTSSAVPSATSDPAPQRTGVQTTGPVPTPAAATEAKGDATAPATSPTTGPVAAEDAAAPVTGAVATAAAATGTGPVPATRAERAATGAIGTLPLTRRGAHQADEAARAADETARVDRAHAMERVRTPAPEVTLTSKRIGQIDDARESSDLLTADRLLDPRQISRPEPEGLWQQLVYSISGHRINLGDGRRARDRKDLDQRIAAPLTGGARFVPVLSRKGGVGKTTVTSLLGMALADARDDRIIAVDANPDRGTLADRVGRPNGRTVRDLVRSHDEVAGYHDVSSIVARDATRLDVLASDADPRVSEAFSDDDYRHVADVAAHYYSIVLTDTGTGIVHSVMGATLELAHTVVIVAGLSVDEARLASETLTWLETNGYAARVRDAVVVLNNSRPGTPLVRESELEAHFRSRVRTVIRMPYDARIAAGSAITFRDLQPSTRQAARELAAAVVEGLRSPVAAA
ncbi:nucleotide-binding protein [Microbacterium sp. 22296]|uniref:MinD/ParA family ATP-binding protein n=1 Tax=Microbacterium sp. 22296 TaxID=3453903 RepID=UPI003F874346